MYPWRRILIPTDFSTASEWVFDDAARLAASTGAEIVIVHVRPTWSDHPDELRLPADESVYEYAEKIELDRLRSRVARVDPAIRTRLNVRRASDAGAEISRLAEEEAADLVVVATHARHHVAHLLVGSTTLSVISNPSAPVLAIRYGVRKREELRKLVVPVHPNQTSNPALELAQQIARDRQGEVHLLTVCGESERKAAEARLAELKTEGDTTAVITGSDVEREIARYLDRTNADALFLNASDQPGRTKIDIIRHAPVPVFIVPAAR